MTFSIAPDGISNKLMRFSDINASVKKLLRSTILWIRLTVNVTFSISNSVSNVSGSLFEMRSNVSNIAFNSLLFMTSPSYEAAGIVTTSSIPNVSKASTTLELISYKSIKS